MKSSEPDSVPNGKILSTSCSPLSSAKNVRNLYLSNYSFLGVQEVFDSFGLQLLILLNLMRMAWGNKLVCKLAKESTIDALEDCCEFYFYCLFYLRWQNCLNHETAWGKDVSGKITNSASETPILLSVSVIWLFCVAGIGEIRQYLSLSYGHNVLLLQAQCSSMLFEVANIPCRDMDGSGDGYTQLSQKEKPMLYVNAYMWNLEKWYRWSYLQGRNSDTDVEKKYKDANWGLGLWDELGEWN